jgi:hypothetical protein
VVYFNFEYEAGLIKLTVWKSLYAADTPPIPRFKIFWLGS